MTNKASTPPTDTAALLGEAIRAVRRARGLRSRQVAEAMGLDIRTYQRFEKGPTTLDLERIQKFAAATDSDPFAIVASLWLKSPDFAVHTMENKPLVVFTLALRACHDEMGEDLALIEPRVWWGAFRRVFQDLAEHVRKRDLTAEAWLDEHAKQLGLPTGFHPGRRRRRAPP